MTAEVQVSDQDRKHIVRNPRGDPTWVKGVSQNPYGRESKAQRRARAENIVAGWAMPFGGVDVLTPAEKVLALTAAELSLCRPRRAEDVIRFANSISRLLAQCGLATKHEREPIEPEPAPDTGDVGERVAERIARAMAALDGGAA